MPLSRRALLSTVPALALADVPSHRWDGYDFGPGPVTDRLNQGPFGVEQDEGWFTIAVTTPSDQHIRNWGLGLVGYTWEESGPSLAARAGKETLEQHVAKISSLPFVDVLYIRCDWRDVQSQPGSLNLHPIWNLTLDAAKQRGLRVGFRDSPTTASPESPACCVSPWKAKTAVFARAARSTPAIRTQARFARHRFSCHPAWMAESSSCAAKSKPKPASVMRSAGRARSLSTPMAR
jgi:hypothetical protein